MNKYKDYIAIITLVIVIFVSAFVVARSSIINQLQQDSIAELDKKTDNVEKLFTITSMSSVGLSMLPGDTATALSEKFADLSIYLIIIMTTIYAQKWIVSISGVMMFRYLIPFFCFIILMQILVYKNERLLRIATKVLILGLSIFLLVPVSITASKTFDMTTEQSIERTNRRAQEAKDEIEEQNSKAKGNESKFMQFLSAIKNGVQNSTIEFERTFKNVCSSIAAMLFTSCVIPLIVLWLLVKILNLLFETNYYLPSLKQVDDMRRNVKRKLEEKTEETNESQKA